MLVGAAELLYSAGRNFRDASRLLRDYIGSSRHSADAPLLPGPLSPGQHSGEAGRKGRRRRTISRRPWRSPATLPLPGRRSGTCGRISGKSGRLHNLDAGLSWRRSSAIRSGWSRTSHLRIMRKAKPNGGPTFKKLIRASVGTMRQNAQSGRDCFSPAVLSLILRLFFSAANSNGIFLDDQQLPT